MRIRIVADSSSNILSLPEIEFANAPLTIATDEKAFVDDASLDIDSMLEYLANYKGRSYTSCPNIEQWLESFDNADIVYVVTITSNLSGAYNSAVQAAKIFKENNPNSKIHIFDTLSTGPSMVLLIEKLVEYIKEGLSFEETVNLCKTYLKYTRLFFSLQSFHNLAQNGRINKAVALIAGKLGIRILATASKDGVIETLEKCRGEQKALKAFVELVKEAGYKGGKVLITHCNNLPFAENIANAIKEHFPKVKISISRMRGLCSFYAEKGGVILGCECDKKYE